MRWFGNGPDGGASGHDRAMARKMQDKYGVNNVATPTGGQYHGQRQRIITEEEPPKAKPRYAIAIIANSDVYTDNTAFRLLRCDVIKQKPYYTVALGAAAWATATDYALDETASGAWAHLVPAGTGDCVFRTLAVSGTEKVTRFNLLNGSPVKHHTSLGPNRSVVIGDIVEDPHEFDFDYEDPYGVFTGWLEYGGGYRQGFAIIHRAYDTGYERAYCTHSEVGFSSWTTTQIPTTASTHANSPRVVCSGAKELSGVVLVGTNYPIFTVQQIVSLDNGANWTVNNVTEIAAMGIGSTTNYTGGMGAAASETYAVFAFQNGDVLRHQAGTTTYSYVTGALPVTWAKRIFHLGNGCFLCFVHNTTYSDYLVSSYRSTNNGSSWAAVSGAGITGVAPEYIGYPMVAEPYVDSGTPGVVVVPFYNADTAAYELLQSVDAGDSWSVLRTYPTAVAPDVDTGWRVLGGGKEWQLVDLGAYADVAAAEGDYSLTAGTDPSRPLALIEGI